MILHRFRSGKLAFFIFLQEGQQLIVPGLYGLILNHIPGLNLPFQFYFFTTTYNMYFHFTGWAAKCPWAALPVPYYRRQANLLTAYVQTTSILCCVLRSPASTGARTSLQEPRRNDCASRWNHEARFPGQAGPKSSRCKYSTGSLRLEFPERTCSDPSIRHCQVMTGRSLPRRIKVL